MKDRLPRIFIVINVFLIFINLTLVAYGSHTYVKSYETKIIKLNQEIKSKDQQIKGLSEQVSRQTKRIAELTGNGG